MDTNLRAYIPFFTYGLIFSDSENLKTDNPRPLDAVRELHWGWKIPINLVLVFLFTSYGAIIEKKTCDVREEDDCAYFNAVTFYSGDYGFWVF